VESLLLVVKLSLELPELLYMSSPTVSVLIPVYNAGKYLRPSVESVLSQSHKALDIIIIDDGSTDRCLETLSDLNDSRVRIISQANRGKPAALNVALPLIRGEYFAIHDADDLSYPFRIEKQVAFLQKHKEIAGVLSGCDVIINDRRLAPQFSEKSVDECRKDIQCMRMPGHDPTIMYRTEMVREIPFETSLPGCEGFDHILRVGELYPLFRLGECLYSYRMNPNSVTWTQAQRISEMVEKVRMRALERRGIAHSASASGKRNGLRVKEEGIITHFIESVLDFKRSGAFGDAVKVALECARLRRKDFLYYKPLLFSLIPAECIDIYRAAKARK
jgi:glycosyltransferase involved in cell wall biosynthesis